MQDGCELRAALFVEGKRLNEIEPSITMCCSINRNTRDGFKINSTELLIRDRQRIY
jgi:hypothetical protein